MAEKVTIQTKLKYLQNRLQKSCSYHNRQASLFCMKINCTKCPFLCNQCLRENSHGHKDSIFQFYEFMKNFCNQLGQKSSSMNNILDEQEKDSEWAIKQQLKYLEYIEVLQKQINQMIQQSKIKLHMHFEKVLSKEKPAAKVKCKIYSNPNILINKINSDLSNNFILELKASLLQRQSQKANYNEVNNQVNKYRNEVSELKNKIKQILNSSVDAMNNAPLSPLKKGWSSNNLKVSFLKQIPLNDYPLNIFSTTQNILIQLAQETYSYNTLEKYRNQTLSFSLRYAVRSNLINDVSYLGLTGSNSIIVSSNQSKISKLNLDIRISTLGYLATYSKNFALLGRDDGSFDIFDIDNSQIKFRHKATEFAIIGIQLFSRNALIVCLYQNSSIHFYKYKNQYQSFSFQYSHQLSLANPFIDISMLRIYQSQMVLFGVNRNILIYDLLLYCQKFRTAFTERSPPFTHGKYIEIGKQNSNQLNLLTLSRAENCIYWWVFDRDKMSLKVDPLSLRESPKQIRQLSGIQVVSDTLWLIQSSQKQAIIYNIKKQSD